MQPWKLQLYQLWNTYKLQSYRPVIRPDVHRAQLVASIAECLNQPHDIVASMWADYLGLVQAKDHIKKLGQVGTLSSEEAFVIHVLARLYQPAHLIEIGTHQGKSTRRILDSIQQLQLNTTVTCFDIEDLVRYFSREEAALVLKDVTHSLASDILDAYEPGIIYLDAHPWHLLHKVIGSVLQRGDWILAIHDCSPILCNPDMTIPRDEPSLITMRTGHWERHVLAALLGVDNPLDTRLGNMETETHLVRVLPTQHGLALIMPKSLIRP